MTAGLRYTVDDHSLIQPESVERRGVHPELPDARRERLRAALRAKEPQRLAVGLLYQNVDREHYQRLLDQAKVNRIVREFDPDALGYPLVCHRADGTWWIIDGQHRVEGLRMLFGVGEEVWCDVIAEREPKEEASVFRKVNTDRTGLTSLQSWHTDRTVGVRDVLDAEQVLQGYGRVVGAGERDIHCAGAIREIVRPKDTGKDDLRWVMDVLLRAWGTNEPALRWAFRAVVMRGLHAFHVRYRAEPGLQPDYLVGRLALLSPEQVALRGDIIRGRVLESGMARGLRANPTQCFAHAIWRVYNERPGGNLLPIRPSRASGLPPRLPEWDRATPAAGGSANG